MRGPPRPGPSCSTPGAFRMQLSEALREVGGDVVNAVMYLTEREGKGGSGRGVGESAPGCGITSYVFEVGGEIGGWKRGSREPCWM